MEFRWSEEQELLRKAAREFAEEVVAPRVAQMEETGEFPAEILGEMGSRGLVGLNVPAEYGGLGLGQLERMITLEEVGRVSSAVAMTLQVFHMGIEPIVRFGNEEQKRRLLPDLASGKRFATVAVTESTGGSDPTGGQATARLEGERYLLNGRKIFITNARLADVQVVMVRTKDDPKEFSVFIVERGFPGFRPGRREKKVGMHGADTGEVILENCPVPKENLLGKEGDGLRIALKVISEVGRSGMAGAALGIARASLEAAAKFAQERVLYGKPISKLQGIQWKVAEMVLDLEASRLIVYRAAWLRDQGIRCDAEMAMAKLHSTEAALKAARYASEVLGGYGVMEDFPVARFYRDALVLGPSGGTSEIMKAVIARSALG